MTWPLKLPTVIPSVDGSRHRLSIEAMMPCSRSCGGICCRAADCRWGDRTSRQLRSMHSTPGRSPKRALRSAVTMVRLVAAAVAAMIKSCAPRWVPDR